MKWRISLRTLSTGLLAFAFGAPTVAQTLAGDGTVICGARYEIASGDTLSRIARMAYGDPLLFGILVDANPDVLRGNPEDISVGTVIEIPCVDASGQPVTGVVAPEAQAALVAALAAEGPLAPTELDALFGPVALFPDQILTPVLVAVTFPLDVVKAGRFLEDRAALSDQERAAQAAEQPWDDSVRQLTAGFPEVVIRMSDHIDWTEQAGEAVVAQTDDVLASIQRLRAKAQETGYLADGPTQNVEVVNNVITIAPSEPGVVYVPTYDSQVVYTTPVTAPPYHYDDGNDWGEALAAGAIILGGAVILDEIFDDDDWDDWNGWDGDDIDWDGGDINIDRGDRNVTIGGGDREITIDNDTVIAGDRPDRGDGDRPTLGGGDRVEARDRPDTLSAADREVARQKIETRKSSGGSLAALPATRPDVSPTASRPAATARVPSTSDRTAEVARPQATRQPTERAASSSNAFRNTSGSRSSSLAASNRGRASLSGRR